MFCFSWFEGSTVAPWRAGGRLPPSALSSVRVMCSTVAGFHFGTWPEGLSFASGPLVFRHPVGSPLLEVCRVAGFHVAAADR